MGNGSHIVENWFYGCAVDAEWTGCAARFVMPTCPSTSSMHKKANPHATNLPDGTRANMLKGGAIPVHARFASQSPSRVDSGG